MYQFRTEPFEHQRQALRAAWGRRAFAYLLEMGTGKSKVAIDEMSALWEGGKIQRVLVVAPKGAYLNWSRREIPLHMPEDILATAAMAEWRPSWGGAANRRKIERVLGHSTGLSVLVMNVEALSAMGSEAMRVAEMHCRAGTTLGVVDESTRIKNPQATRTRSVIALGRLCEYRRILTGSAMTNSPLDVYSQFEFLGQGLLGHTSYFSFRARYAVTRKLTRSGRRPATVVAGYRNLEDLRDRVAEHSFRVTKAQCLDLPPKMYEERTVELTPEQQRLYEQMRSMFLAELEDGSLCSATMAITQITRLQQILCGFAVTDEGEERDIPSVRLSALEELIGDTEGKVVIWSRYVRTIREISQALRRAHGEDSTEEFWGGVSQEGRERARDRFMGDPACRFMVSNQQTGGMGNTWTSASTVVYYSNSHDLELREQSEDRCHRIGQSGSVLYVDLVAPGTVDEHIIRALRRKIDISTIVNGDEYRSWLR